MHRQSPNPLQYARTHRIVLPSNVNKVYDREIITDIGNYMRSTRMTWDSFLEEDSRCHLPSIERSDGDDIVVDFDDLAVAEALRGYPLPVAAVGSSYESVAHYLAKESYVATDNGKLVALAHRHLIEAGLQHLALYSLPQAPGNRWTQERELAFTCLRRQDNPAAPVEQKIYRSLPTSALTWHQAVSRLIEWLRGLPEPIDIIAVADTRARYPLQTCMTVGFAASEEITITGVNNDPLTRTLSRIPLSSVTQDTMKIGRTATHLLCQMLDGTRLVGRQILVPPVGTNVLTSSRHQPPASLYIIRARHFIRRCARQGIKTGQIANYAGISRLLLEEYLCRELNCTVHQEILRHKLGAVKHMLASRDIATARVAVRRGFTSPRYMHVVFRRELDCTPREYQERTTTESQP